jgi:hypothetical protein
MNLYGTAAKTQWGTGRPDLALVIAVLAVVASCAQTGAAAARRSASAGSRSTRARLATWVWTSETVFETEQRRAFFAFAQAHAINTLYLQHSPQYGEPAGFAILVEFLLQTRAAGIEVTFVAGDPSWALNQHHARAAGLLEETGRLNQRLKAAGAPLVRGVQYDVEPYLLADWKARPGVVEPQYVALVADLHQAARREGVELWLTVPFWFEHHPFGSTTLDRVVSDYVDGIVVMAYRDTPAGVVKAAERVLDHAAPAGRPVVVAIEINCAQPAGVALCLASQAQLGQALAELRARLDQFATFSGLAVHQYAYWRALRDGVETP